MTAIAHTSDCPGPRVEHFGLPEHPSRAWHRTSRCVGCGAQSVMRVEPVTEVFGTPITDPPHAHASPLVIGFP